MMASQCKTLSSAFVITAVIVVLCLTGTPRALAQTSSQATGDASNRPSATSLASGGGAGSAKDQSIMDLRDLFSLFIVIVALAAFLRLRIEWAKAHVHPKNRKELLPMLWVELFIGALGLAQVIRILCESLGWTPTVWFDRIILGAFLLSVIFLICLLWSQFKRDLKWIKKGEKFPPEFVQVEAQVKNTFKHMKIRFADIQTMREGGVNNLTVLKIRTGGEVTVSKTWDEWENLHLFEP